MNDPVDEAPPGGVPIAIHAETTARELAGCAILNELRALAGPDGPVTRARAIQHRPALIREASRQFGNWKSALAAAGVPLPRRRQLPRDANLIVADLQALAAAGQSMRPSRMKMSHGTLHREACDRFGTWAGALKAASLELPPPRVDDCTFTRESLLAKLRELAAVVSPLYHDSIVAQPGCASAGKWARRYFGSWNAALEAAGLPVPPPAWKQHLPKHSPALPDAAAVIAAIKERAAAGLPLLKKSLKARKAAGGNLLLDRAAKRFFGSWRAAVDAAEVAAGNAPVVSRRFWNGEDVLTAIRKRHAEGLPLAGRGLFEGLHKDASLYEAGRRFFRSWRDALKAAGLAVEGLRPAAKNRTTADPGAGEADRIVTGLRLPHFTRPQALKELLRRYQAGEPIAARAVQTGGKRGRRLHHDLLRFFGTWKAALAAAGIAPGATRPLHPRHRFSNKEDILRALRARLAAGLPIDLATLNLSRKNGGDTTLAKYARRYYKSWDEVMRDARAMPPAAN